jgi:hypothetical protein
MGKSDAKFTLQHSEKCQYLLREVHAEVTVFVDLAGAQCHLASSSSSSTCQGDSCNTAKYLSLHFTSGHESVSFSFRELNWMQHVQKQLVSLRMLKLRKFLLNRVQNFIHARYVTIRSPVETFNREMQVQVTEKHRLVVKCATWP